MRYFLFAFIALPLFSFSQAANSDLESFLANTGKEILASSEYNKRAAACDTFLSVLKSYVATEEGYDNPLASVSNMLRLAYEDEFRIYTWQMPDPDFKYIKYGLVVVKTNKEIVVTELIDASANMMEPEYKSLKADNWFGAIYYKIIPTGKKRNPTFTLLGFAPDETLNRKIIDVISIDNKGRPKFGDKVFHFDEFMDKTYRKAPLRIILSYGGKYAASVRWNDEKQMIVMDHLSPPDQKLKGVYSTYGPDMSYDGLVWEKGWWNLETEVKFDSHQNIPIVPPNKPTGLPPSEKGF